jgi:outer membrane protein assembly factor BamB
MLLVSVVLAACWSVGCSRVPPAAPAPATEPTETREAGERFAPVGDLPAEATATAQQSASERNTNVTSDWPMFRGNSLLNGVASGTLSEPLVLLWTFTAIDAKHESIESSAAIVNSVVYVGTIGGYLYALDLNDGSIRWRYFTGAATAEPDDDNQSKAAAPAAAELPPAIKSSPAVADGKVFFGDEVGVFHCVDGAGGKLVWKYDTGTGSEIISSANVIGDRVLFGSWDEHLYCLSVADGKEIWKFKTGGPVNCTPAVVDGKTFLSGCDAQLRVVNIEDGSEVGSCEMESQTGASPAVVGDRLFVGHMGSQVLGIDWRKPEIVWRYQHPDRQFEYYSSAAATSHSVVVGGRDKMVHAIDPKTGESKWTFPTKGRVDSSPVIVGNRVFVGSQDGNIYGLDTASGEEVWRFAAGGKFTTSPAVASGRLVIGNDEGKVFCFGEKR